MPTSTNFVLNPLIDEEAMRSPDAQERLNICYRTLGNKASKFPISRKIGRERVFSRVAVEMLRDGNLEALKLYSEGERTVPPVRGYYDRLGIRLPAFLFAGA